MADQGDGTRRVLPRLDSRPGIAVSGAARWLDDDPAGAMPGDAARASAPGGV